ncbi:MAG: DUF4382 domain-containing protein [Haloplanus sp.]
MHDRDETTTYRRDYLAATGAVCLTGVTGLAGCTGGSKTGTLAARVRDAPGDIDDFESCVVTVDGVWLKPSGDGGDGGDGESTASTTPTGTETTATADQSDARTYHEFDDPQTADLVKLQDGKSSLLDDVEVAAGSYEFLQLDVSSVEATRADGGSATVDTPGKAPLQFKQAFEIRADQTTTFVADFTPVKRGKTGRYLLKPVASGTEVHYAAESETATTSG